MDTLHARVLGDRNVLGDVDKQLSLIEHLMGEVKGHTGRGYRGGERTHYKARAGSMAACFSALSPVG
jgi:hypothetical protein